jgi:hypothetical protein
MIKLGDENSVYGGNDILLENIDEEEGTSLLPRRSPSNKL